MLKLAIVMVMVIGVHVFTLTRLHGQRNGANAIFRGIGICYNDQPMPKRAQMVKLRYTPAQ